MDLEIRELQHNGNPHWRIMAQRTGQPIPFQLYDVIEIYPSYTYLGEIHNSGWGGLPCPVRVIITDIGRWKDLTVLEPKIVASLPPPYLYCPQPVAFNRHKVLISYSLE